MTNPLMAASNLESSPFRNTARLTLREYQETTWSRLPL